MDFAFENIVKAFLPLFAIMDPFVSIPVFLALTSRMSEGQKRSVASQAVAVAGGLLFAFLLLGGAVFSFFGITLSDLKVGGGLILLIMGVRAVLGSDENEKVNAKEISAVGVIIGTPLITGPGVITTSVILASQYGLLETSVAALLSLGLTWIVLVQSKLITKAMGEKGTNILSRVMGLLLTAVAVSFIASGIFELIRANLATLLAI